MTLIQGASRMGLRLGELGGEYIIGAWQIGTVLDSAASRAVMPGGSFTGVRTAPKHDGAQYIREHRLVVRRSLVEDCYMNVEGTVKPRYIKSVDQPKNPRQPSAGR